MIIEQIDIHMLVVAFGYLKRFDYDLRILTVH